MMSISTKYVNLIDLYTGDDENFKKTLQFYQKHYIEHMNKLTKPQQIQPMDSPQNEPNSNSYFYKRKVSSFKGMFSSQKNKSKPPHENNMLHSRQNSNLSAKSSSSQALQNTYGKKAKTKMSDPLNLIFVTKF